MLWTGPGPQFVVSTCHLSAGDKPDERVRQLDGVLKTVEKKFGASLSKAAKGQKQVKSVAHVPLVLCGDFNSEPEQAARHFLLKGCIDQTFKDPVSPAVKVTSKPKTHTMVLADVYADAYEASASRSRPDTMIVREIFELFVQRNPNTNASADSDANASASANANANADASASASANANANANANASASANANASANTNTNASANVCVNSNANCQASDKLRERLRVLLDQSRAYHTHIDDDDEFGDSTGDALDVLLLVRFVCIVFGRWHWH